MTELDRRIELEALVAEGEGLKAENKRAQFYGDRPTYGEADFILLAERIRKLKEEKA
jgi:hypothetical protein